MSRGLIRAGVSAHHPGGLTFADPKLKVALLLQTRGMSMSAAASAVESCEQGPSHALRVSEPEVMRGEPHHGQRVVLLMG